MKKLFCICIMCMTVLCSFSQTVKFDDEKNLVLKEVVEVNKSKDALFEQVISTLVDLSPNTNTHLKTEYHDINTGTVIYKGPLYLGFKKVNMMAGYNNYVNTIIIIKCKDNKYQVTIKATSMVLDWSVPEHPNKEEIDVCHVYPAYDGYKTTLYYTKKSIVEFGPEIPNNMISLFKYITTKLNTEEDDF